MYSIGSKITYSTFGGGMRNILVTDKDDDIKNGQPGFDGVVLDGPEAGTSVWGYDTQIVRVIAS